MPQRRGGVSGSGGRLEGMGFANRARRLNLREARKASLMIEVAVKDMDERLAILLRSVQAREEVVKHA